MSELHTCTDLENNLETNEIVHLELHLKRTDNTVSFPLMCPILTQKSSYKTSDKKALSFWNRLFKMERILINKKHVYYQVSGSNSCPSSAITMWLICQNVSGQLAAETMGTSLHRGCKANSRGSFMEMRAPEHKTWKTARNISCDGCKTAWNHFAMLMCAMWRLNAAAQLVPPAKPRIENRQRTYGRSAPGATARHLTQEAAKCRGKFLTGQNVERLHRLLIAFRERVESTTQSDQSGILTSTSHSSYQEHRATVFKAPGWISRRFLPLANTRRKAKVVRTPMVRLQWLNPCGQTRLQCCSLEPCYYIWAGLWLKKATASNHKNTV